MLTYSSGNTDFTFYQMHIKSEYAQIIDKYFDMFGYKTNLVKVPNINSRPHWNYVKTVGCTLTGSVPADSMRHLCQIYDHGITFWNNGNEIGQYNLNNSMT